MELVIEFISVHSMQHFREHMWMTFGVLSAIQNYLHKINKNQQEFYKGGHTIKLSSVTWNVLFENQRN